MKLKNNHPIDNIDKEIEISNLILSLEHFDKNKCLENLNDILNIKTKNIQNEIEKIILKILYDKNYLNKIENFWTNELFISNDDFGYELKENNCLAQKIREKKQIIKSKLKFKEGYIYKIIFNIIYMNKKDDFEVGFGNIELCNSSVSIKEKGGICLSNKGLFIDGIKINEEIYFDDNDTICFILNLKEKEKYFILFINGEQSGKFNFNLENIYTLASLEGKENSVKLKTFIKL